MATSNFNPRTVPSYPIWDDNTLTTTVAATGAATYTTLTIADNVYYIIFAVTTNGKIIFIRDDAATTGSTGIYLEQGAPGPTSFGMRVSEGTVLNVTHDNATAWSHTTFYNSTTRTGAAFPSRP